MFYVCVESPHITHCCDCVPRDVPLCDKSLKHPDMHSLTLHFSHFEFSVSSLYGMTHCTVHPCCSYSRQVLVTSVLQATNLVTKADGIPTVFRVHGCSPASSALFITVVSLKSV